MDEDAKTREANAPVFLLAPFWSFEILDGAVPLAGTGGRAGGGSFKFCEDVVEVIEVLDDL